MRKLEVFIDHTCPYCLRGYETLKELMPQHPDIEVVWRPCEAHPRPEEYGIHSDLCIQGMFFALEQGADAWAYHDRMFSAAQKEKVNIEDPEALAGRVQGLLDADAFLKALRSGVYEKAVTDANDYAYEQSGVWFIPAFRMDGRKLDAAGGAGVTKAQLSAFLGGKESCGNG
ncbi:MAG: DsbA family protein [Oscillospiraceae bacterium]|nr:DsbA family protein [Oscillospiraceae bacterium]